MPDRKTCITAFVAFGCILLIPLVVLVQGCGMMKAIDDAIWKPTPAPPAEPTTDAPPIIEIAAGVLSMLGFGGLAGWLRSVKKKANGSIAELEERVRALEYPPDKH